MSTYEQVLPQVFPYQAVIPASRLAVLIELTAHHSSFAVTVDNVPPLHVRLWMSEATFARLEKHL